MEAASGQYVVSSSIPHCLGGSETVVGVERYTHHNSTPPPSLLVPLPHLHHWVDVHDATANIHTTPVVKNVSPLSVDDDDETHDTETIQSHAVLDGNSGGGEERERHTRLIDLWKSIQTSRELSCEEFTSFQRSIDHNHTPPPQPNSSSANPTFVDVPSMKWSHTTKNNSPTFIIDIGFHNMDCFSNEILLVAAPLSQASPCQTPTYREVTRGFSCSSQISDDSVRDTEVSRMGDSTTSTTRSDRKLAKKERRQRQKDGNVDEAFADNNMGKSCEDEGMEEILVASLRNLEAYMDANEETWATPILGPTSSSSSAPQSSKSRSNLRRGKRDLMRTWLNSTTPGTCEEKNQPMQDWTSNISPHQSPVLLSVTSATEINVGTYSHSLVDSFSLLLPVPLHSSSLLPIPVERPTLAFINETYMMSGSGSGGSSSLGSGTSSLRPRDVMMSIRSLRSTELSDEGLYEDADPRINEMMIIQPPPTLAVNQEGCWGSESTDFRMTSSPIFDDSEAPQHQDVRDSDQVSLVASGLRLQFGPKARNTVTFNRDVYNLDRWDSSTFNHFVLPTQSLPRYTTLHPTTESDSCFLFSNDDGDVDSSHGSRHPPPTGGAFSNLFTDDESAARGRSPMMRVGGWGGGGHQVDSPSDSLSVLTSYFTDNSFRPEQRNNVVSMDSSNFDGEATTNTHSQSGLPHTHVVFVCPSHQEMWFPNNNAGNSRMVERYLQTLVVDHASVTTSSLLLRGDVEDCSKFEQYSDNGQEMYLPCYSDIIGRYVTVHTLVHRATSYTEQLAYPTSGTGLRKFRRDHDRWQPAPEQSMEASSYIE